MNKLKRLVLKINGEVQGKFYREFVWRYIDLCNQTCFTEAKLTGYIDNEDDGGVIICLEGDDDILEKVLPYMYIGSPIARVERIKEGWEDIEERDYSDFDRL